MTDEQRERYLIALPIAAAMLSSDPRYDLSITGYRTTVGDVAAHLIASSAARRRIGDPKAAVASLEIQGREAISQISLATNDPDPAAVRLRKDGVEGRVGSRWILDSGMLKHYGESFYLSGCLRGVHDILPQVDPDIEGLTSRWKDALLDAGLPMDVLDTAHVVVGEKPYELPDGMGVYTSFILPMRDRRIDAKGHILNIHHQSHVLQRNSIHDHAVRAVAVHAMQNDLIHMCNHAEDIAFGACDKVEDLHPDRIELYTVYLRSHLNRENDAVFHVFFHGISEAFRPITLRSVMTGPIASGRVKHIKLDEMVREQKQRSKARRRLGRVMVERTGRLLMEMTEGVPKGLLRNMDEGDGNRIHAGYGTRAWYRVHEGRITANVDVSSEVRWSNTHLEVKQMVPQSVALSLAGRPTTDVVQHAALEGTTIKSAKNMDGRLIVNVEPIWEEFDETHAEGD